jgi:hypothetical protein
MGSSSWESLITKMFLVYPVFYEGTEKLIIKLGLVQSCLYKPFSLGYLRNNKQFGSDKQFSERLFRIYPSILSPIFSKGTFSVPSILQRIFYICYFNFLCEFFNVLFAIYHNHN